MASDILAPSGGITSALTNVFGNFNAEYSKEDQRRMRYIQTKFVSAYGGEDQGTDPNRVIDSQDPNSKLKMDAAGKKPANPFPHERAWEESLIRNHGRIAGHEGRFAASHALTSIGSLIEYQKQRKSRTWVPKVSYHGRPNDYVNMFLEELKVWLGRHLTKDEVSTEELDKRSRYLTKLKNDNYHWCFPNETELGGGSYKIHDTLDFVHERVDDARATLRREESNKSLQRLFTELNNHTTNTLEFGKNFLAYLLCASTAAGADLPSRARTQGSTYENGRLLRTLEETASVRQVPLLSTPSSTAPTLVL
jgi:hypothetical protein